MKTNSTILFGILCLLCFPVSNSHSEDLEASFKSPPSRACPRTWMHAMSGNMSKAGMTKDLEAIAAAGQGGILLFNIANGIPYGDVPYASQEHHRIITHAAAQCERLNLSFGFHNCDGWTSSGGPWIMPEQSMKMVVWSETVVDGGAVDLKLPQPTTHEDFYKEIAVLAYHSLPSEIIDAASTPTVTASDESFDVDLVTDGSTSNSARLSPDGKKDAWIMFDYGKEHEISSYYLAYSRNNDQFSLQTSNDGENFTEARQGRVNHRIGKQKLISRDEFDPIKARYFRFSFETPVELRDVKLTQRRPFKNYIGYSGLGAPGSYVDIIRPQDPKSIIAKDSIINLTDSLDSDGKLSSKLPEGKWTILRFGYTSTGARNWPASKWGRGLECDKFSRPALKVHFDSFCKKVIDNVENMAPNALQYIEIDSYEMGGQNWTEGFAERFEQMKGYDIRTYLPVLAGRYVESPEATAGIAFDLNEVCCHLMNQNYFRYFTELCHEKGLKSYVEPYGTGPLSTLDASEYIDLPMTEFWMNRPVQKRLTGTIHGAHIYGNKIISAEAFTATRDLNWKVHPALAKTWGDMSWVAGVNEFMYHRFVHQANTHVEPGLTMGYWGSNFDRTQTWWMNAGKQWFGYHARGSYLLRHGYHAADVLVFVGDVPHKDGLKREKIAYPLPLGINYDCTNAKALHDRLAIENRTLVLPDGNPYSHLILQDSRLITLPTLRRLREFVDAGVPVIGKKPIRLAGYKISEQEQQEFEELCEHIWSQPNCKTDFDFSTLQPDFSVVGVDKGFIHRKNCEADIFFFYNEKEEPVSYECRFRIANKVPELWDATTGEITKLARFKSEGATTRVWIDLDSLESAFIVFRESAEEVPSIVQTDTEADLTLLADGDVSVQTQSEKASTITWSDGKISKIPATKLPEIIDLSSDWTVHFPAQQGAASKMAFARLIDWTEHEDDRLKYFSGTATYTRTFKLDEFQSEGLRYILDLGSVDVVADVIVNGKEAGVLWMAPFEIDLTEHLERGENTLEIRITNQWANRLIGDENFPRHDGYRKEGYVPDPNSEMPDWYVNNEPMPAGPRETFCGHGFYTKGDALEPSGLKGPVTIRYERVVKLSNN